MCYSLLIKASLPRLAQEFGAHINQESFAAALAQKNQDPRWRFPRGWEREILTLPNFSQNLKSLVRESQQLERERWQTEILKFQSEAKVQKNQTPKKLDSLEKKRAKLEVRLNRTIEEEDKDDWRVFPFTFSPILASYGGSRSILAARYRVQGAGGIEVPPSYNVFNARRDSLQKAATWKPLFGKAHGLSLFTGFYEWVEREQKKEEILFTGTARELLWAPALVQGLGKNGSSLPSFALITDEPPPEVASAGHDRCPILLSATAISAWLNPGTKSLTELDSLLDSREKVFYSHRLAA
jgi:putative SOS response-associated peptidase YedK